MENKEEVLQALEEFSRKLPPSCKVPALLEEYLHSIAQNGETIFPWPKLKPLFIAKLEQVMNEFLELCPHGAPTPCPNVENVKFEEMRQRLLDYINLFNGAPFTIQRLCELLTNPRKHYRRTDKFLRGIEKNVMIVSTVDPFGKKIVRESKTMVNGLESNGHHGNRDTKPDDNKETESVSSSAVSSDSSLTSWLKNSMVTSWPTSNTTESVTDGRGSLINRDQENGTSGGHDFHSEVDGGDSSTSSESESPLSSENEESMDTMETVSKLSEQTVITEQPDQMKEGEEDADKTAATTEDEQAEGLLITSSENQEVIESSDSLSRTQTPLSADSTSTQSETQHSISAETSLEQEQCASSVSASKPSLQTTRHGSQLSHNTESPVPNTVTDTDRNVTMVTDTTIDTNSGTDTSVTDRMTDANIIGTMTDTNLSDTVTDINVTDGVTDTVVIDASMTDSSVTSSEDVTRTDTSERNDELDKSDTTNPDLTENIEKPKDPLEITSSDQESAGALCESSENEDRTNVAQEQDKVPSVSENRSEIGCLSQSSPADINSDSEADMTNIQPNSCEVLESVDNTTECSKEDMHRTKNVEADILSPSGDRVPDILSQTESQFETGPAGGQCDPCEVACSNHGNSVSDQTVQEMSEVDRTRTQPNEEPMDMD